LLLFDLEKTYENIKAFPQKLGAPITGTVQTPSGQKNGSRLPCCQSRKKVASDQKQNSSDEF